MCSPAGWRGQIGVPTGQTTEKLLEVFDYCWYTDGSAGFVFGNSAVPSYYVGGESRT